MPVLPTPPHNSAPAPNRQVAATGHAWRNATWDRPHSAGLRGRRARGSTHADVWSAAADGDARVVGIWCAALARRRGRGVTRKRRGVEYGRPVPVSGSRSVVESSTRQYNTRNLGYCASLSAAQRRKAARGHRVGDGHSGGGVVMPTDVDAREVWSGWTAMMLAAAGGHVDIVRALLVVGANPRLPAADTDRMTAVMLAALQGRLEVVRLLVRAQPEVVNQRSSSAHGRKTCLHLACETDRVDIVRWLLENDTTKDHGYVEVVSPDDEQSYSEAVSEVLAVHRKQNSDAKFMIKAASMRANLGF